MPDIGDFRVDAGEETKRELEEQYRNSFEEKLNDALKDIWERLHTTLSHMSEKLADAQTPRVAKDGTENRTQIFRDSLITNAFDLCNLLTKLNVTNDPKLEEARRKLEVAISGRDAEVIRDSDAVRHDVKRKVDEILSAFDF